MSKGVWILAILLYIAPSIIGVIRRSRHMNGILAMNILLGWTVAGWIVALVWALRLNPGDVAPV